MREFPAGSESNCHWRAFKATSMAYELSNVEPVKENYAPLKSGRVFSGPGLRAQSGGPADWEKRIAASADPLAVWKECVPKKSASSLRGCLPQFLCP